MNKFKEIIEILQTANPGSRPDLVAVDHTNAENPYISLYREEKWEEKINETSYMNDCISINTIVMEIYNHSK